MDGCLTYSVVSHSGSQRAAWRTRFQGAAWTCGKNPCCCSLLSLTTRWMAVTQVSLPQPRQGPKGETGLQGVAGRVGDPVRTLNHIQSSFKNFVFISPSKPWRHSPQGPPGAAGTPGARGIPGNVVSDLLQLCAVITIQKMQMTWMTHGVFSLRVYQESLGLQDQLGWEETRSGSSSSGWQQLSYSRCSKWSPIMYIMSVVPTDILLVLLRADEVLFSGRLG